MARIYKTNGEVINVEPKNGTDFKVDELQEIVGGTFDIKRLKENRVMVWYDGEYTLTKQKNKKATSIYQSETLSRVIVFGDVLICKSSEIL